MVKRAFTREDALAAGFVEDVDFWVNHSNVVVSLRENVERECESCRRTLGSTKFYSGLHKTCRACQFRAEKGILPGTAEWAGKEMAVREESARKAKQKGLPPPVEPPVPPLVVQPEGNFPVSPLAAALHNELNPQHAADLRLDQPRAPILPFEKEMALRVLSRRRLVHFIERFHPGYKAGWVHKDICRRLERFLHAVAAGKSPRLLIFCPPRLGKSLIASQYFPAWALGHHPEFEFIAASYNVSLPIGFSRRIRETVRDPVYAAMFPETRLSEESQAVEAWRTTQGGGYVAAGVGTGITGKGAHIFVVDDPVKDMEAADSANTRESTWEWWNAVAYTRIAPGGGVLGIQTRWNDDDWSGRIIVAMNTGEGEVYEVCSYPAINEEGDEYLLPDDRIAQIGDGQAPPEGAQLLRSKGQALHPARYDLDHLLRIKNNLIASGQRRVWSALYQQNPVPDEGAFFRKDMFRFVATPPPRANGRIFQSWDFSITEKETSDWIVGACLMQDEHDNVYEMDMMRFKVDEDSHALVDAILDFYEHWDTFIVGFEDGQIFKSIKSLLLRRAVERRISLNFKTLTPLTDKMVRAGPLRGRMQMGKLFFAQNSPYRTAVDNELLRFPGGKHDDIVDALAWCMRLILEHAPVKAPHDRKEDKRRRRDEKTVAQKLQRFLRGSRSHMSA